MFLETFSQLISYWLFSTLVTSSNKSNIGQLPFQSICDQQGFLALLHSSKSKKSRQQAQHLCLTLNPTGGCTQWKRTRSKFLFFPWKTKASAEKRQATSLGLQKMKKYGLRENNSIVYILFMWSGRLSGKTVGMQQMSVASPRLQAGKKDWYERCNVWP